MLYVVSLAYHSTAKGVEPLATASLMNWSARANVSVKGREDSPPTRPLCPAPPLPMRSLT